MKSRTILLALSLALGTAACATTNSGPQTVLAQAPQVATITSSQRDLLVLPPPASRMTVAVYSFVDQTGQFKDREGSQTLSRVVSQGATSMLVKALQDAGNRAWFQVMERERLDNLLKERQIIREMRQRYLGEEQVNPEALPSLLFAGVLLEGGVIGYDTNTISGGAGARYLGVGGHTEYRQDTVTVYLRAVSVKTGEVLTTVVSRKTVASVAVSASAFRYVSFKELLEAETGITTNEPDQLALQEAIEKAVHSLVLEGAQLGYWRFADQSAASPLIEEYLRARRGVYEASNLPLDPSPTAQAGHQKLAINQRRDTRGAKLSVSPAGAVSGTGPAGAPSAQADQQPKPAGTPASSSSSSSSSSNADAGAARIFGSPVGR